MATQRIQVHVFALLKELTKTVMLTQNEVEFLLTASSPQWADVYCTAHTHFSHTPP